MAGGVSEQPQGGSTESKLITGRDTRYMYKSLHYRHSCSTLCEVYVDMCMCEEFFWKSGFIYMYYMLKILDVVLRGLINL